MFGKIKLFLVWGGGKQGPSTCLWHGRQRVCLHPAASNQRDAGPCSGGLESGSLPSTLHTFIYSYVRHNKNPQERMQRMSKRELCVWQNGSPTCKHFNKVISNWITNYRQITLAYLSVLVCGPFSERIIVCIVVTHDKAKQKWPLSHLTE